MARRECDICGEFGPGQNYSVDYKKTFVCIDCFETSLEMCECCGQYYYERDIVVTPFGTECSDCSISEYSDMETI